MFKKIFIKTLQGVAWGCTVFTILGLIFAIKGGSDFTSMTTGEYIKQVIASIICGIGFLIPTISYECKNLSKSIQIFIHMGIGIIVYIFSALYAGWIPTEYGMGIVFSTITIMIVMSFIIWSGFYIYFKREAKIINMKIKDLDN